MTPSRLAVVRTKPPSREQRIVARNADSSSQTTARHSTDQCLLAVLLGATNPLASAPGTIRGDFSIDVGRNVCHGSDSVENAKKEIALWFKDGEVISYKAAQFDWVYEKP